MHRHARTDGNARGPRPHCPRGGGVKMLLFFILSVSFTHPCSIFSFAARQTMKAAKGRGGLFSVRCLYGLKYFILKKGSDSGGWVGGRGGGVICELTSRERERACLSLEVSNKLATCPQCPPPPPPPPHPKAAGISSSSPPPPRTS